MPLSTSEPIEEKFIRLLKYANARKIKSYLIANPSINLHHPTIDLRTPLTVAIDRDDHQILTLVLDRIPTNLDETTTQPCGRTALMYSAFTSRNPEVLQALLRKGADAQKTDLRGWTCLHYAVVGERLKNVTFLLEHGVAVDARDRRGRTPFMISAYLSRVDILLCLLSHGADVHATDNVGCTALKLAILWCNRQAAITLLEKSIDSISISESGLCEIAATTMPDLLRCLSEKPRKIKYKEVNYLNS